MVKIEREYTYMCAGRGNINNQVREQTMEISEQFLADVINSKAEAVVFLLQSSSSVDACAMCANGISLGGIRYAV